MGGIRVKGQDFDSWQPVKDRPNGLGGNRGVFAAGVEQRLRVLAVYQIDGVEIIEGS